MMQARRRWFQGIMCLHDSEGVRGSPPGRTSNEPLPRIHMVELCEAGKVVPVIDGCYPLSDTGEALRRVGDKQSKGKVIITP